MVNPRRVFLLVIFLLLLPLLLVHFAVFMQTTKLDLPPYEEVEIRYLANQNWNDDERQWYYHETQGGAFEVIVPFKWMLAFEQPRLPVFVFGEVRKLMDDEYLSRYGFLSNAKKSYRLENVDIEWAPFPDGLRGVEDTLNNPFQLPVGFARDDEYYWPTDTEEPMDVIGFTCAACHTAQLNFEKDDVNYGVRIDGGPALTHLAKFELATGVAAALTELIPTRFNRFANEVLGEGHSKEDRQNLKAELKDFNAQGKKLLPIAKRVYPTLGGYGRLDAMGRIGNFIFAEEFSEDNWDLFGDVANAPVNFPHIWDSPWFDWVQYNAAIKRPMIRNAGESMGVFARINVKDLDDPDQLFKSTSKVDNIFELESLLKGEEPFDGLRAPEWPEEIFGDIDRVQAERGHRLYVRHCQSCHLPPPIPGSEFYNKSNRDIWTAPDSISGLQYLNLNVVNIYEIGTDPLQAANFARRIVDMGPLGQKFRDTLGVGSGGEVPYGQGLPFVVTQMVEKKYDEFGLSDSLRYIWNGKRPNDIRALLAYKARPLSGIWATAPFLHNGAVPNLFQMISPHAERDKTFYLGSKKFDTEHVGFETKRVRGLFKLDTSLPGNSNYGHLFEGDFDPDTVDWDTVRTGVIGPRLSPQDRLDIVEFLKTL